MLLQKRIIELVRGAPPVIESPEKERGPIEVALREILEGKISLEMIPSDDFEKLVEQARQEKEARGGREQDESQRGCERRGKAAGPEAGIPRGCAHEERWELHHNVLLEGKSHSKQRYRDTTDVPQE